MVTEPAARPPLDARVLRSCLGQFALRHGRVDPAHSLLPPPGRYHVQIGDVETLATITQCGIKIGQDIHPPAGPIDIDFLRPA
jgi:hypothetical protein